jgi:lipoate-protein ligase A
VNAAAPAGKSGAGPDPAGARVKPQVRLMVHPKMPGARAMAVDEALTLPGSPVTARLYGFSPPALSVGRLQRIKGSLDADALRRDGIGLVRRPTGGHAVLHDDELTYSVAMSKADAERIIGSFRKREVYNYIARILLRGLELLGIRAIVNAALQGNSRNPDCFASTGEYEIAAPRGEKLIGSAQMTTRTAVLQQGSIPISDPSGRVMRYLKENARLESAPSSCLAREAGRHLSFTEVQEAFARAFRECMGAEDAVLTPLEEEAADRLLSMKYATDAWNVMY